MTPLIRALSLREQQISFCMPSNIIFDQTNCDQYTYVNRTKHKDKAEETREGVMKMSLYETNLN